jgi:hypothetical protein
VTSQHRKHRGYDTQRILARYLAGNGWPYAEPTGAGRKGTDILGTPGIDWEVFARRDGLTVALAKMKQSAARVGDQQISVHVMRPDGYGPQRIAEWPAFMPLNRFTELLHAAGYGDPPE